MRQHLVHLLYHDYTKPYILSNTILIAGHGYLLVERELRNLEISDTQLMMHNLTQGQRKALKDLKNKPHIIIRPADKGNTVMVMDRGLYEKSVYDLLNDDKTYDKLGVDQMCQTCGPRVNFLRPKRGARNLTGAVTF